MDSASLALFARNLLKKVSAHIRAKLGTFGHIASFFFYPAHHITMGKGGAVVTDDDILGRVPTSNIVMVVFLVTP